MSYDAVLVLGGGLADDGSPAPWAKARLDAALRVPGEPWIVTLSAGTTHKPPQRTAQGFPIHESQAGADYLRSLGCAPERILLDTWSLDTVGNAYFARFMHCEPRRFSKLLAITSDFHMARTRLVFDWVFSVEPRPVEFRLSYRAAPDVGLDAEMLALRREKERESLDLIRPTASSVRTVEALHEFVFQRHGAYRSGERPQASAAPWAASY